MGGMLRFVFSGTIMMTLYRDIIIIITTTTTTTTTTYSMEQNPS